MTGDILAVAGASFAAAFGLWTAGRLATGALRWPSCEEVNKPDVVAPPAQGRLRESSCLALAGPSVRHTDGSYSAAYVAELPPTLLARDERVDELYEKMARLLTSEKPDGTLLQLRWTNHLDHGRTVWDALGRGAAGIYEPARYLEEAAHRDLLRRLRDEGFRAGKLSVWCRVPGRHETDHRQNGLGAWWRVLREALRQDNVVGAWQRAAATTRDRIIRRLAAQEKEVRATAEGVFRLVEREFPLRLKRLSRAELWPALYLGHNEQMRRVPTLPDESAGFFDLRDLLGQDDIKAGSDYLLHGDVPVALVSLTLPPQPRTENGILRALTQNPNLRFRYTLVVDYLYRSKKKSLKKLNTALFWHSRSPFKAPEAQRAGAELEQVRHDLAAPNVALATARVYVVVYGPPVKSQADLETATKLLDENCDAVVEVFKSLPGADAVREDITALRALYPHTLPGELSGYTTGLEIDELAPALATFAPLEGAWQGQAVPHTMLENVSGELFGLNLFNAKNNVGALGVVLGRSGSGKSVLLSKIINGVLSGVPEARVVAVDFGETYAPAVQALGGRQVRFVPDEAKTLNIWDYEGLAAGGEPDEAQIALVVGDLLNLAGLAEGSETVALKSALCERVVREVYRNIVPLNGAEQERREPLHSDFLNLLESFPFVGVERQEAEKLRILLERYRGHLWLDAPTSPEFVASDVRFEVYELDSLERFSPDVAATLAYRVVGRIIVGAGRKVNGRFQPKLQIFDEMHKIAEKYPQILSALVRGARQGRKENAVTLLATHAYEDLAQLHGLTANAGIWLIGKQSGDFSLLAKHAGLSDAGVEAVRSIHNVAGSHAQFLVAFDSGPDLQAEVVQLVLSPEELWTYSSHPVERNARARVAESLLPGEPLLTGIGWLAAKFPRGLAALGLSELPPEAEDELEVRRSLLSSGDFSVAGALAFGDGSVATGDACASPKEVEQLLLSLRFLLGRVRQLGEVGGLDLPDWYGEAIALSSVLEGCSSS